VQNSVFVSQVDDLVSALVLSSLKSRDLGLELLNLGLVLRLELGVDGLEMIHVNIGNSVLKIRSLEIQLRGLSLALLKLSIACLKLRDLIGLHLEG